jgi:hypothetical protein
MTSTARRNLYAEHRTPAMWNVPSRLTTERAKRSRWPDFPVSPAEAHDRLAGTVRFRGGHRGEYKTAQMADRIQAAVPRLLAEIEPDDLTRFSREPSPSMPRLARGSARGLGFVASADPACISQLDNPIVFATHV